MSNPPSAEITELHVAAVSAEHGRLSELVAGLKQAQVREVTPKEDMDQLKSFLASTRPDAILIDISAASFAAMPDLTELAWGTSCPIALFVDSDVEINLGQLIDAGICTVVVDGLAAKRIPHLLETTLHRHKKMRGLQIQLEAALSALEERKLVDQAKGILIEQRGISEPEAHKLLRQAAMANSCKLSDIAQTIIVASKV